MRESHRTEEEDGMITNNNLPSINGGNLKFLYYMYTICNHYEQPLVQQKDAMVTIHLPC